MMPEVARSLRGCKDHLGCADGVLRLLMDFDIFLPPGVGGLGGGGVIVLDAAVLHDYTGQGDRLPGAYTHELGHNIGFGHDPYMLLADCGRGDLRGTRISATQRPRFPEDHSLAAR